MNERAVQTATTATDGGVFDEDLAGVHLRIVERDKSALLECFDRFGPFVYCHALLRTGSPAAAEDLTEEVFLALWREPEEFRPTDGPVALQLLRRMARVA